MRSTEMAVRNGKRELAAFSLALVPYLLLVRGFWWVDEDAFISFRFAYNLARGEGLRFNLGERIPVEGYSNFVWVLWSSLIEFVGGDVTFWVPLTSAFLGAVLLYRVFIVLRNDLGLNLWLATLATLSLAVFPPFAVWSTSGLETVPAALALFIAFEQIVIRREDTWRGGLAGLALTLLRVEGLAWALLVGLCAFLSSRLSAVRTRKIPLTYFTIVIVGFGIFLAWRYSYYHSLIANTAVAKNIGVSPASIERGMRYVAVYVLTFLTPLLILPAGVIALSKTRRPVGLPILIFSVAPIGYSIVVGGDYMTMGRFLVQMLPFTALLFGWLLQWLSERNLSVKGTLAVGATATLVMIAGLLPAADIHVVPEQIRARIDWKSPPYLTEVEKWNVQRRHSVRQREMALALKDLTRPEDTLVTIAVGNLGYYSHLFIYDQSGLLDREVAAKPVTQLIAPGHDKLVPPEFFLKEHPTIIEADIVPMRSLDRTVETFESRRRYLQQTFGANYVTDVKRLKVTADPGARRAILANLLYPLRVFRSEEKERPLDYAVIVLRSHQQGSSSTQ
jgi:arabinofuranosyltransferase